MATLSLVSSTDGVRRMSTTPMRSLLLSLALAACSEPPGPAQEPVDTNPPPGQAPDTGFPPGDRASVMLTRVLQEDGTRVVELHGLVADNVQGFYNAAQCAITGGTCLPVLPPLEDDYIQFDPTVTFQPQLSQYGYLGLDVTLGPWRAHYVNDGDAGFPHYYSDLTPKYGKESIFGWYGVRLDGTWGKYRGEADLYVSPELDLRSPEPNSTIAFNDTDALALQWVPDGYGTVFLTVVEEGIGANVTRLYWLEDDGYFELPVRDLGLGTGDETLQFTMSRWNTNTLDIRGHTLDLVATSEVAFEGEYFFVDGRTRALDADTCNQSAVLPGVQPGRYWGQLAEAGYQNDIQSACGFTVSGQDAIVPVDLAPREAVLATLTLPEANASLAVVRDCQATATCLARSDAGNPATGGPESIVYENTTDEPERVYLLLDAVGSAPGIYALDVQLQQLLEPPMHDTCVDAMDPTNTPVTTGTYVYYTNFLAYTPGTDPGTNGCTGTALPGSDSMMKVQLAAGQTITAKIDMQGSDPALYLLYQCNNPGASCRAGIDAHVAQPGETLIYKNSSGQTENMFLVIDTKSANGLKPYKLTLDIH